MSNQELVLVDEVTEEIANNLTESKKENKINQLKTFETQIITGLSDETSIINHVIVMERDFFQTWANTLKQLHYLNYYEEPLNTICSSIFSKIGKMKNLSTDRKENLHRNLRRSLDNEFKQIQESDKMSPQNTSDVTSKESIILEAFESLEHYHSEFIEIIKIFRSHLKDPAVHKDMEAWFDKWEKIARLCEPLSELSGDYSVLKQMADEGNMRESATLLQRAFAKLLYVDGGFGQMAHGFGVVPRQNQRIRNRDEDWPEKDAKTVIRNVTLTMLPRLRNACYHWQEIQCKRNRDRRSKTSRKKIQTT